MFDMNSIEGIDTLRKEIPEELQAWHYFGHNISELHYNRIFDTGICGYLSCIELVLTDSSERYAIKLSLYNVSGELRFDMVNGFYGGFMIEDLSDHGYEKNSRFRISSFEPDIGFSVYCERIKAEPIR